MSQGTTEDWTNTLDRDGLRLVSDQTYTFLPLWKRYVIQCKWTKANVEEQTEEKFNHYKLLYHFTE